MYDCATTCYDFSLENKKILIYMFLNFYRHEIKKKYGPPIHFGLFKKVLVQKDTIFFLLMDPNTSNDRLFQK